MTRLPILCLAAIGSGLAAQSNTVPGLDGKLEILDNITYWGRRGAAYPNGEVGLSMRNTMCNPGSVSIPWYAAMQPNHPKFGFVIMRLSGDRMEQISDRSYCKHAFTSASTSGACGPCNGVGGNLMGVTCSDTYSAGNNADRYWLGPPQEIDPWLGTWAPTGSYFDRGDPDVGAPGNMDGNRSLTQGQVGAFDPVKNRVTIKESDLSVAGAQYFYGIQLIHQGEAVANRWDNIKSRGFTPTWTGSGWSVVNSGPGETFGSILQHWPGSTVNSGGNGNDDGRFFVAAKVTPLGGSNYHYEYAVHNVDNSRAGATLRIPIDAGAVASNYSFRDIDQNPLNNWTAARVGNEIVFTAPASNPLEWNTIYNFGFDANFPPGTSTCRIDEARVGPGALWVTVQTQVPGGSTIASFANFGQPCPGSTQVVLPPCGQFNPAGGPLANTLSTNEYAYRVASTGTVQVEYFDVWTASTAGPITVQARIYATAGSLPPATTPLATTSLTIDSTPGFYRATFTPPVTVTNSYYLAFDNTAQTTYVSNLLAGNSNVVYFRANGAPTWTLQVLKPAFIVECVTPPQYLEPMLANSGLPLLGGSYGINLTDGLASSIALLVSGLSDSNYGGLPLPAPLPGAPGCSLFVAPEVLDAVLTSPTGTASSSVTVPNVSTLIGLSVFHQWAVLDAPANALGIVVSDAGHALLGN